MLDELKPYTKAIVAFLVFALQWGVLYLTLTEDNSLSNQDKAALLNNIILALGGTAAVYTFPNRKG